MHAASSAARPRGSVANDCMFAVVADQLSHTADRAEKKKGLQSGDESAEAADVQRPQRRNGFKGHVF